MIAINFAREDPTPILLLIPGANYKWVKYSTQLTQSLGLNKQYSTGGQCTVDVATL